MHAARLSLLAAAAVLAGCADVNGPRLPSASTGLSTNRSGSASATGGVFTQTNDAAGNAIVAYARHANGSLSYLGTYPTGGRGTAPASGLGSQGAVVLTPNERFLIAVNAGSDQLSSFAVDKDGLSLVGTVWSGGTRPISAAATNHVLYALNNGSSTLAGFRIENDGSLTAVPGWTRPLSRNGANAAQAQFTRDGRYLIVVHRAAPGFDVFPVNPDGSLGAAVFSPSVGTAPFGFDITARGQLIVSEPGPNPGGAPQSASSYALQADGSLRTVSGGIEAFQTAPCWVVITHDGRFAYTANAGGGSISGFAVTASGGLTLITADGRTGITGPGSTPLDMDVSRDSRFLYVIEGGTGNIMGFAIANDGSLEPMADAASPLAARARGGLAAY